MIPESSFFHDQADVFQKFRQRFEILQRHDQLADVVDAPRRVRFLARPPHVQIPRFLEDARCQVGVGFGGQILAPAPEIVEQAA